MGVDRQLREVVLGRMPGFRIEERDLSVGVQQAFGRLYCSEPRVYWGEGRGGRGKRAAFVPSCDG